MHQTFKKFLNSQHWDRDRLDQEQIDRFRELLKHCSAHVPYYRTMLDKAGIDPQSAKPEDLSQLPILTRALVRTNYSSGAITASNKEEFQFVVQKTGGSSTGEPLATIEDTHTSDAGRAAFYRGLSWANWWIGEKTIKLWGQKSDRSFSANLAHAMMNWEPVDAFSMSDELFQRTTEKLKTGKVKHMYSYVSALVEYCHYLNQNNITVPPLESVMTTAEVLTQSSRDLIESTLNTRVFNGYACGEINGIAYECEEQNGLHIAEERCIVEILDDNNQPVPEGTVGKVVVTDLYNKVMPLIRYENGDQASMKHEPCACGRVHARLMEIGGRTCDIIDGVNGKSLHSYFFTTLFSSLDWEEKLGLKKYQIIQESERQLDVHIESDKMPSAEDRKELVEKLTAYLGDMKYNLIANEGTIELTRSGKLRWTINKTRL